MLCSSSFVPEDDEERVDEHLEWVAILGNHQAGYTDRTKNNAKLQLATSVVGLIIPGG